MQKLVNDVGAGQAPGVEDRRLVPVVIADHADQAVADPAERIADREGRDPLEPDPVGAEAEICLPVGKEGMLGGRGMSDNKSQSSLRPRRASATSEVNKNKSHLQSIAERARTTERSRHGGAMGLRVIVGGGSAGLDCASAGEGRNRVRTKSLALRELDLSETGPAP